jgi:cytochrome c553
MRAMETMIRQCCGVLAAGLLLTACSEARSNIVEDKTCAAGVRWAGSEAQEGATDESLWDSPHVAAGEMHPGRDCVACHDRAKEGPDPYVVSGTVFHKLAERNDCFGVGSVTVLIKDSKGKTYTLPSNEAGNFWLEQDEAPGFSPPFSASIRFGGVERSMFTKQTNGNCLRCHTAKGTAPAGAGAPPGRICVDPNDPVCTP